MANPEYAANDSYSAEKVGGYVVFPQMWRQDPRFAAREYYRHRHNVDELNSLISSTGSVESQERARLLVAKSEEVMRRIQEVCPNVSELAAEYQGKLNKTMEECRPFFVSHKDLNVPPDFSLTNPLLK